MMAYHCDRDGCDSWQRLPTANPLWLVLKGGSGSLARESHFCTLDCLMHWAAERSAPTETVAS